MENIEDIHESTDSLIFNVDAGLIDRLGRELVGRSETAVSELVKNAYDADAKLVEVKFINSNFVGGTLKIIDDGLGMTRAQLQKGFMTISSSDKIHNPISERFQRSKAGRKGIGRFATHRLGRKLTIITQTLESDSALKLTINWDDYVIDTDLTSIKNPIEEIEKTKPEGTELIIENLREYWTQAEIKRIYRYVSDLFQPDYLSDRSRDLNLAIQDDESFEVSFTEEIFGVEVAIANPNKMIFEKALAVIEGYIDNEYNGFCTVSSNSLELDNNLIPILYNKKETAIITTEEGEEKEEKIIIDKYKHLNNIHFKIYYFIYNREIYYTNISKTELTNIQKIAKEQGGIKLYRNGFRVLPYGERGNDWLGIDKRYFDASGVTNIPSGNQNLFGFVEIVDQSGDQFEETASREGVLENESYIELRDFVSKSLFAAINRIRAQITRKKLEIEERNAPINPINDSPQTPLEKLDSLQSSIDDLIDGNLSSEDSSRQKDNIRQSIEGLKSDFRKLLDELGMTRVLAGLGLTIGEFTHEVVQFSPSLYGDLDVISDQPLTADGLTSLENLKRTIKLFTSYTSYFNATVSENVSRELKPQEIDVLVTKFINVISSDLNKLNIDLIVEPYGYHLFTIPMHSSEWTSILFNLYTNSKKAIKRRDAKGKIKIVIGKENERIYLEFLDNGDGVPDENRNKIFDAFFTTSTPAGFDATNDERLTGTGLGLKIVKDIVETYGGTIDLIEPESDYATCIRIEMPLATEKQKSDYDV